MSSRWEQWFYITLYLRPVGLVLRNPESLKRNRVNGDLIQRAASHLIQIMLMSIKYPHPELRSGWLFEDELGTTQLRSIRESGTRAVT